MGEESGADGQKPVVAALGRLTLLPLPWRHFTCCERVRERVGGAAGLERLQNVSPANRAFKKYPGTKAAKPLRVLGIVCGY
jgi:hypothetical protein